jgi:hypothetical protein
MAWSIHTRLQPAPIGPQAATAGRTGRLLQRTGASHPRNVAHASTLGMGNSCSTEQAQEGHASNQRRHLAEGGIHWIATGRRVLYRGGLDRPVVSWAARVGLVRATKQVVDSRPRQAPAGLPRSAHRWRQRRSPGRARARRPRAAARAGHTRRAADRRQRGPGRGPGPPRRRSRAPARDRPRPPGCPTAARTSQRASGLRAGASASGPSCWAATVDPGAIALGTWSPMPCRPGRGG